MGKQSARIVYQGKDHKDIYFQGNYHRAMYKGERLMWMKMGGKKYAPIVRRVNGEYGVYIYYPESRSIERLLELERDRTLFLMEPFCSRTNLNLFREMRRTSFHMIAKKMTLKIQQKADVFATNQALGSFGHSLAIVEK